MLVLTQDGNQAITPIGIRTNNLNLVCDTSDYFGLTIGKFETNERCKEVLKQLMTCYCETFIVPEK